MKKMTPIALAIVCALSLFAISGCESSEQPGQPEAQSQEQAQEPQEPQGPTAEEIEALVLDSLTAELEAVKNRDEAFIAALAANPSIAELEMYGIDAQRYADRYFKGFDYSVGDVVVSDDRASATVEVVLTCKSAAAYAELIETDLQKGIAAWSTEDISEEELNDLIGDTMMGLLQYVDAVATDPVTLTYVEQDGAWMPDAASTAALSAAIMGN